MKNSKIVVAAKCAPDLSILSAIRDAGLPAVELYTNSHWLKKIPEVVSLCKEFPFRYAIHAPIDTFQPAELADLAECIGAEVVVFHNVFWDDEWDIIKRSFIGMRSKICVENVVSVHEPIKFMRRFGIGRCLDLEHLQMESGGVFEEEFVKVMRTACHVHMSGYSFGTELWHTHIHHSPEHCRYLLNLLKEAEYKGMIVSEARVCYQTYEEFFKLSSFVLEWENGASRELGKDQG